MKGKAINALHRFMNSTLMQVLELWRVHTTQEKQLRAKARKTVQRVMNATLVQVFELWVFNTQERGAVNAKASRIICQSKRNMLLSIVQAWRQVTVRLLLLETVMDRAVTRIGGSRRLGYQPPHAEEDFA